MKLERFSIARLPRIEFGSGVFDRLEDIINSYGQRVMLVRNLLVMAHARFRLHHVGMS